MRLGDGSKETDEELLPKMANPSSSNRGALAVNERNSIEMTFNNMYISIYLHHNKVIERIT